MKKQAAAAERKKIMFQPYSAILGRFLSEKTEHTVSMAMPLMLMVKAEFGASLSSITILPGTFANRSEGELRAAGELVGRSMGYNRSIY